MEGVKLLLKYKPDVSIFNIFGITPIMKICSMKESEHMDEIVELLVDAGAQIDEKDFKSKRTALQVSHQLHFMLSIIKVYEGTSDSL